MIDPDVLRYVTDGAASGETSAENRRALDAWRLVPRVLVDVGAATAATEILGVTAAAPIVVAPMAAQRMVHPDGELAMGRAAAGVGVPMVLSLSSTTPVEEVAAIDGIDLWFQVYPFADAGETRRVVERAIEAGARAVVVTVDMPPPGRAGAVGRAVPLPPGVTYAHHGADPAMSTSFAWPDLAELIATTPVPVVVKGVLHPDDAVRVADAGAAGVVVSNHGGRVLDGIVGAADALAWIGERWTEFGGRTSRFVDGSIDNGVDVVRALALGADAAFVGRTLLTALIDGGEAVTRRLDELVVSIERALAVVGARSVSVVTRQHVTRVPGDSGQYVNQPPSTVSDVPVTNEASAEQA